MLGGAIRPYLGYPTREKVLIATCVSIDSLVHAPMFTFLQGSEWQQEGDEFSIQTRNGPITRYLIA